MEENNFKVIHITFVVNIDLAKLFADLRIQRSDMFDCIKTLTKITDTAV